MCHLGSTFKSSTSFVFCIYHKHTHVNAPLRHTHDAVVKVWRVWRQTLPAADAAANANAAQSKKTAANRREVKLHAAEELLQDNKGKYSLQRQPGNSQSLPLGFHGWTELLCSIVVMICVPSACTQPPPPQPQPPECDESDWFSVPLEEGRGWGSEGYSPCFGLFTFHLEAVKRDPHMLAEGTDLDNTPTPLP